MSSEWGGKRSNAGRKSIPEDRHRVSVTFSVDPLTRDRLRRLRALSGEVNAEVEKTIHLLFSEKFPEG